MSEDEDEELAMLRLQALMSKRRGGAGASKDLPIPPLLLGPVEPAAAVSTEAPLPILPVVVTSAPIAVTDPADGGTNDGGTYRQPHFVRGQASYCRSSGGASSSTIHHISYYCFISIFQGDGFRVHNTSCICLLYTSPSPRDGLLSRMPSSA